MFATFILLLSNAWALSPLAQYRIHGLELRAGQTPGTEVRAQFEGHQALQWEQFADVEITVLFAEEKLVMNAKRAVFKADQILLTHLSRARLIRKSSEHEIFLIEAQPSKAGLIFNRTTDQLSIPAFHLKVGNKRIEGHSLVVDFKGRRMFTLGDASDSRMHPLEQFEYDWTPVRPKRLKRSHRLKK